jgi:hypothetical protein
MLADDVADFALFDLVAALSIRVRHTLLACCCPAPRAVAREPVSATGCERFAPAATRYCDRAPTRPCASMRTTNAPALPPQDYSSERLLSPSASLQSPDQCSQTAHLAAQALITPRVDHVFRNPEGQRTALHQCAVTGRPIANVVYCLAARTRGCGCIGHTPQFTRSALSG